jgi:hypothetical protein
VPGRPCASSTPRAHRGETLGRASDCLWSATTVRCPGKSKVSPVLPGTQGISPPTYYFQHVEVIRVLGRWKNHGERQYWQSGVGKLHEQGPGHLLRGSFGQQASSVGGVVGRRSTGAFQSPGLGVDGSFSDDALACFKERLNAERLPRGVSGRIGLSAKPRLRHLELLVPDQGVGQR